MSETWTIRELAAQASGVLRAGAASGGPSDGPASGRVREVPTERLIRWYTTIGLVDPPLTRRGRIALYGRRHLLQLVAVKRLQAAGHSIADIQAALTGATDTQLESAARLPSARPHPRAPEPASPGHPNGAGGDAPTGRERFWTAAPRDPAATSPMPPAAFTDSAVPPAIPAAAVNGPLSPALVQGVRLAPGVTVLLEGASRTASPEDLAAIVTAAGPLLAVLRGRGLLAPAHLDGTTPHPTHLDGTTPRSGPLPALGTDINHETDRSSSQGGTS
ncbi:hypothetical protein Misp01_72020 [Microtetraspora sp. NBRC 13810]|uniref:helix-turn-helix domain-containing protein n=1 Tax=Microtetraspora sp. NBRC 13810 TaxID=3030990 RepID=UPI0024A50D9D|nr:MerR family transcriptional regulator [Microtetraspora sp. NBRC 13810]GLW12074.1 hypothetical protein Misp01_72020 [Microtetraspora sp. NBRC 13810]